ncbi:MAG: hypothetical protein U1E20_09180 [Methylocystis sp.]|uniref:hypothetical protein n=1 Tax=Methylocystis sp. TaxID=1911079 RepID=UPI00395AD7D3
MEAERSYEPLTKDDLARLGAIAQDVLRDRVFRTPVGHRYKDRLILLALCQGAAQHYVDGVTGVKDLDVWAFFRGGIEKPFPWRARWSVDFGPSRLGRHPADEGYLGRRVDVMGRSIPADKLTGEDAVRAWLHGRSKSARLLVKRPAIGLFPRELFAKPLWSPESPS